MPITLGSLLCSLCLQRGLGWLSETRAPLPGPGKTLAQHYQLGGQRGLCTDVLLAAAVSTLPVPLAVLPVMGGAGPSVVLVSQPLVGSARRVLPAHSCPALGKTDSGKPVGNGSRVVQPIFFLCHHGPKQRWRGCACPCSYLTVPVPLALARVRCLCFAGRGFRGLVMGGTSWGPYTPLPHFSPSHSTLLKRKDQLSP